MSHNKRVDATAQAAPLGEEVWAEKRRLATALRRILELVTTTAAPEDELRVAADRVERWATQLEKQPRHFVSWMEPDAAISDAVGGLVDLSPLKGLANPLAAPMRLWIDGNMVRGAVNFGWAYQGPPGHLHGGFVAAMFDEALGMVQSLTGRPGMTGTLLIRYRKPTPLNTDLRLEAVVRRVEERKIFTEARVYAGETLTAEGEAIFISARPVTMPGLMRTGTGITEQ